MDAPALVLAAYDPQLHRPRVLALSGDRQLIRVFLERAIADAASALEHAGPFAHAERMERARLGAIANQLGFAVHSTGEVSCRG